MTRTKTLARLALPLMFVLGLTACETFEGVGEDVQSGGQAIENTAEEAQS